MGELVVLGKSGPLELGLSGPERIAQRVRLIWTTPKRTVPLDRDFGLDTIYIDRPTRLARLGLTVDGIEATEKYEPGVKVLSVDWVEDPQEAMNGKLIPKIKLALVEGS